MDVGLSDVVNPFLLLTPAELQRARVRAQKVEQQQQRAREEATASFQSYADHPAVKAALGARDAGVGPSSRPNLPVVFDDSSLPPLPPLEAECLRILVALPLDALILRWVNHHLLDGNGISTRPYRVQTHSTSSEASRRAQKSAAGAETARTTGKEASGGAEPAKDGGEGNEGGRRHHHRHHHHRRHDRAHGRRHAEGSKKDGEGKREAERSHDGSTASSVTSSSAASRRGGGSEGAENPNSLIDALQTPEIVLSSPTRRARARSTLASLDEEAVEVVTDSESDSGSHSESDSGSSTSSSKSSKSTSSSSSTSSSNATASGIRDESEGVEPSATTASPTRRSSVSSPTRGRRTSLTRGGGRGGAAGRGRRQSLVGGAGRRGSVTKTAPEVPPPPPVPAPTVAALVIRHDQKKLVVENFTTDMESGGPMALLLHRLSHSHDRLLESLTLRLLAPAMHYGGRESARTSPLAATHILHLLRGASVTSWIHSTIVRPMWIFSTSDSPTASPIALPAPGGGPATAPSSPGTFSTGNDSEIDLGFGSIRFVSSPFFTFPPSTTLFLLHFSADVTVLTRASLGSLDSSAVPVRTQQRPAPVVPRKRLGNERATTARIRGSARRERSWSHR